MYSCILGIITALLSFAICVFMYENDHSFIQAGIGFFLYILPFMFISSFRSATAAFLLTFPTMALSYVIFKYQYYDILWGIALAFIIGGTIFIFRINPYKPFSPSKYKQGIVERHSK
jgi:hypothetical protein